MFVFPSAFGQGPKPEKVAVLHRAPESRMGREGRPDSLGEPQGQLRGAKSGSSSRKRAEGPVRGVLTEHSGPTSPPLSVKGS